MSEYYLRYLKVDLPLAIADEIIDTSINLRKTNSLLPLTIAVLDVGGNLIALKREDGCGILRADIAIGKAWGALGMGISSRSIRNRLADRPAFQSAISAAAQGRFIPVPGGVLIANSDKQVIGAIGISGDASDKDEFTAITAVKSVGLISYPEEPKEDWQDAGL